MRDTDKYVYFWNVVFNTRRNPNFTGKHVNASVNRIHTTFSIETKQEDMIELFKAQTFKTEMFTKYSEFTTSSKTDQKKEDSTKTITRMTVLVCTIIFLIAVASSVLITDR